MKRPRRLWVVERRVAEHPQEEWKPVGYEGVYATRDLGRLGLERDRGFGIFRLVLYIPATGRGK
jgi:hypothetical protein